MIQNSEGGVASSQAYTAYRRSQLAGAKRFCNKKRREKGASLSLYYSKVSMLLPTERSHMLRYQDWGYCCCFQSIWVFFLIFSINHLGYKIVKNTNHVLPVSNLSTLQPLKDINKSDIE